MDRKIEYELNEWLYAAEDLGKEGIRVGDGTRDLQRRKLSYCISREVLIQCEEILGVAEELLRSMEEVIGFIENQQNVKILRR